MIRPSKLTGGQATAAPTALVHDFALAIVESKSLATKLAPPETLGDGEPQSTCRPSQPGRPAELWIRPGRDVKVPSIEGFADREQRVRILHALANHELQAVELFAWALLAFPEAPPEFRHGLLHILTDEQRHTRMYIARLTAAGATFGDFPVSGYFWNKIDTIRSPLDFICAMSLTFENANLDHTTEYATAARKAGDHKTAIVIDKVHRDEVEHVRFGWQWLQVFKPRDRSAWQTYGEHLTWPLRPAKARGRIFHRQGREAAGLEAEFIRRLEESSG